MPTTAGSDAAPLATLQDIRTFVFATLADLRAGRVDCDVARTVGYLASTAVRVCEAADLEGRLKALEDRVLPLLDEVMQTPAR